MLCDAILYVDYNRKKAKYLLKNELADVLGNLLNRSVVPVMNPDQIYPAMDIEMTQTIDGASELVEALKTVPGKSFWSMLFAS